MMVAKPLTHQSITARYIPALTGLRAVAAYLVFIHHYNPAPTDTIAHRLFNQGYVGVSIFFVLSGFLIYHQYATSFNSNGSWRAYAQNRLARIVPLYIFLLLLTIGANAARGQVTNWLDFSLNLTFLKGLFNDFKFSGIAQSWSLTVELCFYAAAPFLIQQMRRVSPLLIVIWTTCFGLSLWLTVGQLGLYGLFDSLSFVTFYTFFGRAFEFIVGMWLAQQGQNNRLTTIRYPALPGWIILTACVLWQANISLLTSDPTWLFWSEVIVYNYILPIGIAHLLLSLVRKKSWLSYFLSTPLLQTLGRSSYAFYLIHLGLIPKSLQKLGLGNNYWLLFSLLVLIAYVLHQTVEKPLYKRWYKAA
jgi:peptidoglycan/LPS O-acetylase OafA/YrhL